MTVGRCRWIATQHCCKKKRLGSESLNKKKGERQIDLKDLWRKKGARRSNQLLR
jgi:hypothetical protein